ncbi:hypothetical protein [Oceanisphaera sp. W20_SRM_FM3]|uniref:hypothetical protein n=1 Tax=Oceanisphaera sp. W20_SRM_FM3 TaxID=3240267 RepID=UPI003F9D473C
MNLKALFSRQMLATLLMAGSVVLSGCASTGSDHVNGQADPRLTSGNDAKFFSKSGFQACAVGAGAGVLACALSNSGNKAQCAVIAGIAACGVAIGANYYLDQRRAQYANTNERLHLMSQDIKQDSAQVVARTATVQQVISDDKATLARIEQDMKNKTADQAKVKQEIAAIDQNIGLMRRDLANMQKKVANYEEVARQERSSGAGQDVAEVEVEIAQMIAKVNNLEQEVDGLYNQRSAITLG